MDEEVSSDDGSTGAGDMGDQVPPNVNQQMRVNNLSAAAQSMSHVGRHLHMSELMPAGTLSQLTRWLRLETPGFHQFSQCRAEVPIRHTVEDMLVRRSQLVPVQRRCPISEYHPIIIQLWAAWRYQQLGIRILLLMLR